MSDDVWKHYEGQVVSRKYTLLRHVGGSDHSVVFITEHDEAPERKAAIKFISADFPSVDILFSRWQRAAQLRHKHLLGVFDAGSCRLAEMDLVYVVVERAEEDLSQILPQRALTVPETKGVLDPLLDVLAYLHAEGFAHAHLKPSNIHAIAEQLKLSSDTLLAFGESPVAPRVHDSFDAPESERAPFSAANDVWSLGATVFQVLTQQLPAVPLEQSAEPIVPQELPEPYRKIVQHSLRQNPEQRWKLAEIAAALNPVAAATVPVPSPVMAPVVTPAVAPVVKPDAVPSRAAVTPTVASVSPLSVPLSAEPAIPVAKLPAQNIRPAASAKPSREPNAPVVLPNYVIPVLLGAAILLMAVFALPKLFHYRPSSPDPSQTASADSRPAAPPVRSSGVATTPKDATKSASPRSTPPATTKHPATEPAQSHSVTPAPAVLHTDNFPSAVTAKPSKSVQGRGEVLDPVLPEASAKALATIQGTVRIVVRVNVNAAGSVTNATLDSPGASKYFSSLAEQAARQWEFSSPEVDGRSVPSEWLIRFEFTQAGAHAFPSQVQP